MPGKDAFGTTLERGDGLETGEVFTPIANVTNIQPPSLSRETIDVTAHNSADGWMEFVGSLKDGGEVSFDVNYDPALHDVLVQDFEDTEPRNWQVVFPVTPVATWKFAAIMTGFEPEAPYDDKLAASLTLKVSGKPTIS